MIAHRLAECWLEIKETLVQRCWILAIQGYHFGARFAAANDLKGSSSMPAMTALATVAAGSRVKPSSGPAFDDLIMGVSVAPG